MLLFTKKNPKNNNNNNIGDVDFSQKCMVRLYFAKRPHLFWNGRFGIEVYTLTFREIHVGCLAKKKIRKRARGYNFLTQKIMTKRRERNSYGQLLLRTVFPAYISFLHRIFFTAFSPTKRRYDHFFFSFIGTGRLERRIVFDKPNPITGKPDRSSP